MYKIKNINSQPLYNINTSWKKNTVSSTIDAVDRCHEVLYSPIGNFPAEYCEYQSVDIFHASLPWLVSTFPDLRLATKGRITVAEYASTIILSEKKQKSAPEWQVVIESSSRNRKKAITIIKGLKSAIPSMKLKDLSKIFGKKFATGSSVKLSPNNEEIIEIQGNLAYDVGEYLEKEYKIDPDRIKMIMMNNII